MATAMTSVPSVHPAQVFSAEVGRHQEHNLRLKAKTRVRIHIGCARKQQWVFDRFCIPSHVLSPAPWTSPCWS